MKKAFRIILWIVLVVYLLALVKILFLDRITIGGTLPPLGKYIQRNTNLIPFKTIGEFMTRYRENTINTDTVVKNLLGNLILLLPMGFLFPCVFSGLRRSAALLSVIFGINLLLEIMQILFRTGSFDIDDLILNFIGACIGYGMWVVCRSMLKCFQKRKLT